MLKGIFLSIVVFILITFDQSIVAVNNFGDNAGGNSDTIQALVINNNSAILASINDMTGKEIFRLIDSLLDQQAIPVDLIMEINDYAESRFLKHDYYVSLTSYYDNSVYPANSLYGSWNTEQVYPYNNMSVGQDTVSMLVLEDKVNFCDFQMPIEGVLTSGFGWRDGKNHNGVDIDLQVWDPVAASFDGMVRIAKVHGGYGRVVVIRHYNGLETLYAHLHRIKVKPGDVVEAGQVIGLGGSSGKSTGSHLHYEMRYKGKPLNPLSIINMKERELYNDTILLKKTKWSYSALPKGVKYHTIVKGDYLYGIAEKYGVSVNDICHWNGIKRNSVLRVGRKLRIST